jgi:hypothetical protein
VAHIDRRKRNGTLRYVARYIDPGGRERSRSFTRHKDAEAYLTEIEAARLKGTWVDPAHGRILFRDWPDEWWGSVVNLRPSTRLRDATYLRRYVLPRFGELPLEAIRQREVRAWVAWMLAQGFAPATVAKAYQLLNKVMSAAVDAGMLTISPCRNVPLPRAEPKEMRYLNPAEVAALAAGVVDVAETINELKGRLALGPPKTKASRRKVSLPGRRRRGAGRAPAVAGPAHRLRVPGTRRPGAADLQLPPAHLTPRRGRRQPRRPANP